MFNYILADVSGVVRGTFFINSNINFLGTKNIIFFAYVTPGPEYP